jgi:Flp pilus assembly protein TadG
MMKSNLKTRAQRGAVMIEMALVSLFVLIPLLFGIIEFSLILYNQAMITNASREGARFGIVSRSPRYTDAAISSEVGVYCDQWLVTFGNQGNADVIVSRDDSNGNGIYTDFGDNLRVRVEYDYTFLVFPHLSLMGFGNTLNLLATAVMKYE